MNIDSLFSYITGVVAILFILVIMLVFVYIYDNLRRGKKVTSTA